MPRAYLPHPYLPTEEPQTNAAQTMAWRARRDACRSDAEIAVMSHARRERAAAVRQMAHAMLLDPASSPMGRVWAARIVMRVQVEPGQADWAERHRARERERMRRRRQEGDTALTEETTRKRLRERAIGARTERKRRARAQAAAEAAVPSRWAAELALLERAVLEAEAAFATGDLLRVG